MVFQLLFEGTVVYLRVHKKSRAKQARQRVKLYYNLVTSCFLCTFFIVACCNVVVLKNLWEIITKGTS
jgi:hypothetical protein